MSSTIELYRSPWRHQFERALGGLSDQLIIAAPFIKKSEAEYVCNRLRLEGSNKRPYVRIITDLRTESILGGSLDMDALKIFQDSMDDSEIITLPHLHAKVYIFDTSLAIVGSANLTRSGLDSNYEYNIGIRDPILVSRIKTDIDAYARIGNILHRNDIDELSQVAKEISAEYQSVQSSAAISAKRQFDEKLKRANLRFAEALVGTRSAHSLFSEAILYILTQGPLSTRQLHPRIQQLLPDLCNDSEELIINGKKFGKAWKHHVRNAQVNLRRTGLIVLDNGRWHLVSNNE